MLSSKHHIKCAMIIISQNWHLSLTSGCLLAIIYHFGLINGHYRTQLAFGYDQWPLSNVIGIWEWATAIIKHNWHLGMTSGHYLTWSLAFGNLTNGHYVPYLIGGWWNLSLGWRLCNCSISKLGPIGFGNETY